MKNQFSIIRKIPHFKGKFRLVKFLLKKYISSSQNIHLIGKYEIEYLLPNIKEIIGFELFCDGIYELDFIKYFVENIPENGVFLDLGANIGSVCIPIAKLRPDVKIIAVEASPRVYEYLKKNVGLNNIPNIKTINKALSDSSGEIIKFYSPEELFGKGSMKSVFTEKYEEVLSITLDELIKVEEIGKVDWIKIDVEGFEYFVFKGANKTLSPTTGPSIVLEFVDWAEKGVEGIKEGAAQDLLREMNYIMYDLQPPKSPRRLNNSLKSGFAMLLAKKKS